MSLSTPYLHKSFAIKRNGSHKMYHTREVRSVAIRRFLACFIGPRLILEPYYNVIRSNHFVLYSLLFNIHNHPSKLYAIICNLIVHTALYSNSVNKYKQHQLDDFFFKFCILFCFVIILLKLHFTLKIVIDTILYATNIY